MSYSNWSEFIAIGMILIAVGMSVFQPINESYSNFDECLIAVGMSVFQQLDECLIAIGMSVFQQLDECLIAVGMSVFQQFCNWNECLPANGMISIQI